ncbi:MAG: T9SS type A sorting domain-containing protein [Flavobacteriales bacterium]|nr:T9SS type A sorting domain-containing protein [Flavobacteriales bacterium]
MRTLNKLLACAMALVVPLCTWAQTETEPNNSSGGATAVTYNTAMAGSMGACAPTDNTDDYFSFTPPAQGQLRVQSSMSNSGPTDLEVTFQVRQSSTAVIGTFTLTAGANGVPVNDSFLFPCQGAGLYYISIENPAGGACTNYSFTYDIVAPVFANDAEPNDGSGNAVTVGVGVWQEGQIDFRYGNNSDYFRIDLPTHGVLNIEWEAEHAGTTSPAVATLVLRQTSTAAVQTWNLPVGANSTAATQSVSIDCRSNSNFYYLSVTTGICGTSYRFRYTVTPPLFVNDAEPNDGSGSAIVLAHSTQTQGQINFSTYVENSDYYRLDLPTQGILNIHWEAENAGPSGSGTVQVVLRSSSTSAIQTWNLPVGANSVPTTQTVSIDCRSNTGFYYLSLASDICGVSYRFSYTVTPPIFNNDVEPNNSSGQATAIPYSTPTQGQINFSTYVENADYYRLDLPTSGILNIHWEAEHASAIPGSATLRLRQTSTAQLQSWTVPVGENSIPASQTVSITCRGNQNFYYLQVEGVSCGTSYRLSYTVTPAIYAIEPATGFSSGGAAHIRLDSANVQGQLDFYYGQTTTYYRFIHPGGPLVLSMLAEHAGPVAADYTVRLRSSSTSFLQDVTGSAGGNSTPLSTTVDFGVRGNALYYIELFGTPCGLSYAINCDDADGDGVCNYFDLCAGTPTGEGVNTDGCSCSQVVTDDNDVCTLDECLNGNVSNTFQDADNDLTCDANDGCPNDPNKIAPGVCGCGVADTDTDTDGTADCNDLCPNDPNKTAPGICGCGVSDVDTDSDGTADCNDLCPNDPNKVAPGACGCGVADTDSDSDGTPDCNDACPLLANLVNGNPCDDGNANTINDVVSNCICAGTLLGNDCEGVPGGPAQPGTACNDNDDCTTGDVYDTNCLCAGTFADADNDGTCDADDLCPGGLEPGTACNDNDDCTTGDVIGANCLCAGTFADADADGTCDADDLCPGGPEPGTVCDDFNANTINDIIGANCLCAGTLLGNDCEGVPGGPAVPGTACDDNDDCTTGDVYDANCLCAGTFADADTDGTCDADDLCPGGPEPGTACSDNNACTTGDVIGTNCLCAGTFADADNDGTCDANDLCPGGPEPGTACNDNNANTNNDVIGTNCLCAGTPIGGGCQPTQLTTTPDPVVTCNIVNVKLDGTTTLWAYEVPGANRYQFLFTNIPGQPAYSRSIAGPDRSRQLFKWYTTPLKAGRTYRVTVRASFDNGATWCAYGSMCTIRISNQPNAQFRDLEEGDELSPADDDVTLQLFPNPVRDGRVTVNMTGLSVLDEQPVVIDVFDALGRRVHSEQSAAANGELNHVMQMATDIGTGLYTVIVSMGDERYHERIVIE